MIFGKMAARQIEQTIIVAPFGRAVQTAPHWWEMAASRAV
jgi:hypothetical protein